MPPTRSLDDDPDVEHPQQIKHGMGFGAGERDHQQVALPHPVEEPFPIVGGHALILEAEDLDDEQFSVGPGVIRVERVDDPQEYLRDHSADHHPASLRHQQIIQKPSYLIELDFLSEEDRFMM